MGKLKSTTKQRGWIAFAGTSLIMIAIIIILLGISRKQLHQQTIDQEFHILDTSYQENLQDIEMNSLSSDLNISSSAPFLSDLNKLELAALECLNIPQVFGVQAYDLSGKSLDLSTSLHFSSLNGETLTKVLLERWGHQINQEETWSLFFLSEEFEHSYVIEFQLLVEPLYTSFNAIDQTILKQGVFLMLGAILLLALIYQKLFSQLAAKEHSLIEQSKVLAETNLKLSQVYKTVGLGSMTGHLMHGLKTPLTNLQAITRDLITKEGFMEPDLQKTVEDIQCMVSRALQSLQEIEAGKEQYTLSIGEFVELVQKRFDQDFPDAKLWAQFSSSKKISLNNLQCQLTLAILENLFKNSIDAKTDAEISLKFDTSKEGALKLIVSDNAGGIASPITEKIFSPISSTKPGGSGIGLALSYQLAESMEGSLQLEHSNSSGTSFSLSIPMPLSLSY